MAFSRAKVSHAAEWGLITIGLFLITDSFAQLLEVGSNLQGDSNPRQLMVALMVYAAAMVLMIRKPMPTLRILAQRPELLVLILLPLISSIWAEEHTVVFRRAVAQALTVMFCIYLAQRLTPEEFLRRLILVLLIGGALSLLLGAAHTSFAVTPSGPNTGSWRGLYGHKAFLGRISAIGIFTPLILRPRNQFDRLVRIAMICIFSVLCVMSQSRAAWLSVIGGVAALGVLGVLKTRRVSSGLKLTMGVVLATGIAAAIALTFTILLTAMGRTTTFSGRTNLWAGAIQVAAENHPWLGAGYRGFWLGDTTDQVHAFVISFSKVPDHAHNGYLDTWFELGWLGVGVLALFVIITSFRLLKRLLAEPDSRIWLYFMLQVALFLATNLAATVAFRHSDISWSLMILASIYTLRWRPKRAVVQVQARVIGAATAAPVHARSMPVA